MEALYSAYVQLDPKLQEVFSLLITALVSFLILQVSLKLPWLGEYLGQYKVGIATWLTALVVQLVQAGLDKIPMEWDSVASLAMQLIAEVILILLGFAIYSRSRTRSEQVPGRERGFQWRFVSPLSPPHQRNSWRTQ